jgi:hypothetical protein
MAMVVPFAVGHGGSAHHFKKAGLHNPVRGHPSDRSRYLPEADRMLMQVRTRAGELVSIWFTRRLMLRLWKTLQELAARLAAARTTPDAVAVPQAREMLSQAARQRVLQDTDFKTPPDRTPTMLN